MVNRGIDPGFPDRDTVIRKLEDLIEAEGKPEPYLESECGYLSGLQDALRVLKGQAPERDV